MIFFLMQDLPQKVETSDTPRFEHPFGLISRIARYIINTPHPGVYENIAIVCSVISVRRALFHGTREI